jgi:hypothetical protein
VRSVPGSSRRALRDAGVPDLLRTAADLIEARGFTTGTLIDPASGAVSAEGAVLLAAGARHLVSFDLDPAATGVPRRNHGVASAALDLADLVDASTATAAARALRRIAIDVDLVP